MFTGQFTWVWYWKKLQKRDHRGESLVIGAIFHSYFLEKPQELFLGTFKGTYSKRKRQASSWEVLDLQSCKIIANISTIWKTKLLLIWTFLTAAKPTLLSGFVRSNLVPHQALFPTPQDWAPCVLSFHIHLECTIWQKQLTCGAGLPFSSLTHRHFSLLFPCYLWKDITILTLLHSSQQGSCLLANVNCSVSTKRKNAIPSDWLNK